MLVGNISVSETINFCFLDFLSNSALMAGSREKALDLGNPLFLEDFSYKFGKLAKNKFF